jgi:acetamidase/formamidase
MTEHHLAAERLHFAWDNSLPPVLRVAPGDSVTIETWDASRHEIRRTSTSQDAANRKRDPAIGHALTGPIAIDGARAGQTLVIDVLDVAPAAWGWTSFSPGRGLLADDFRHTYLRIWDLENCRSARGLDGVQVPLAPFCGVMGVALAEHGAHSTMPPRRVGGNMDVRQLTAGSTLYLPIEVDNALFSVGDAHAAQGDGEVCITATETGLIGTFELHVRGDMSLEWPLAETATHMITMAFDPDLDDCVVIALRQMIDLIVKRAGITREQAYTLCSLAADLRVTQVVNGNKGIHVMLDKKYLARA